MESLSYTQTVQTPTFISTGSLLDHVYVTNEILTIIDTSAVNVYFSDHDGIKITLNFQWINLIYLIDTILNFQVDDIFFHCNLC